MVSKVLKNDKILKKTNWQRKTYPLKLKPLDIQQLRLETMAYEFKNIVNGAIGVIIKNLYPKFILNGVDKLEKEKCPLCKATKKLTHILEDYEIQTYGNDFRRVVYKKGERIKVCNCFEGKTSPNHRIMRMFMLPSKNRTPKKENNITQFGRSMVNTVYDSAIQKAMECIKSQIEIKQKLQWKINFLRNRILENQIQINKKDGNGYELYGEKLLKKFIRKDEKMIEKLKKRFSEKIEYKYDVIRLYGNTYKLIEDDGDYYIKIMDYVKKKWMTLEFFGKDYQKKLAKNFINNKNAETEIIRKGDNFYLQYIYRKEMDVPTPTEKFNAVGIDVNIVNLASYVSIDKKLSQIKIKFYSGRELRNKRRRFKEVRKIWNSKMKWTKSGGKGRSRKWFNDKVYSQNEKSYVKYEIHNLTTKIIQEIKDTVESPVIVLEKLGNIRDRIGEEIKITKVSIEKLDKKQQKAILSKKLLNSELNNWNFDEFQRFIEYKANWFGIPVVYVSAKNTSIKCNKCGYTHNNNYKDYHQVKFRCDKCGYECNADFNASLNIAKIFYEELSNNLSEIKITR